MQKFFTFRQSRNEDSFCQSVNSKIKFDWCSLRGSVLAVTSPDVSSRDETLISGRGPVLRLLACWLPWNQQRSAGEFVVFTWFQCSLCVVDLAERFRYSESDLRPSSLLLGLIPVSLIPVGLIPVSACWSHPRWRRFSSHFRTFYLLLYATRTTN